MFSFSKTLEAQSLLNKNNMMKYLKTLGVLSLVLFAQATALAPLNATAELAIVCDFEFGERFGHDETEIRKYLAIRMYDVNLRLKTLPGVDINFVVTSLTTIKSKTTQDFIENHRDSIGKVSIETILHSFRSWWVNARDRSNLPKYDFVLLALSADTNDNRKSLAYVDTACSTSHGFAVVRFEKDKWWSSCGSLETGLSTVLGALADENYAEECHNQKYIKGRECSKNHFFFSSCTNKAIHTSIRHSSCLRRIDSDVASVFNITELNVQPPSLQEQCILMTNNSNIWVNVSDENRCFSTICFSGNKTNFTAEKILYPVDNSPCDNDKSCFRGRCIPIGFQIQNTVSLNCLHSSNRFTPDDPLHLINCPDVPTALDRFMIVEKDDHSVYLATPYTSINGSENSDKCMSYATCLNRVQFKHCSKLSSQTSDLNWELVDIENGLDNFLLRHKVSQLCLASTTSDTVKMINCSSEGKIMHWKFHDTRKPPLSVFWKSKATPKPTKMNTSPITLDYYYMSTTTSYISSNSAEVTNQITHKTTEFTASNRNWHITQFSCHNWWVYIGFGAFLLVTVILSLIVFKMHKTNEQIIRRQLLTQDFHELSRIIATENNISNRHLI